MIITVFSNIYIERTFDFPDTESRPGLITSNTSGGRALQAAETLVRIQASSGMMFFLSTFLMCAAQSGDGFLPFRSGRSVGLVCAHTGGCRGRLTSVDERRERRRALQAGQ